MFCLADRNCLHIELIDILFPLGLRKLDLEVLWIPWRHLNIHLECCKIHIGFFYVWILKTFDNTSEWVLWKKASFKSTDAIQAPGSVIHKTFLIDSVLKYGASTHLFSFFEFTIIVKVPSGPGLKKILENHSLSIPLFLSFITPFFKSFFYLIIQNLYFCFISRVFKILVTDRLSVEINFQTMLYYTKYIFVICKFFPIVLMEFDITSLKCFCKIIEFFNISITNL